MSFPRFLLLSSVLFSLYSCASPAVYGPAKNSTSKGYSETAIEANRYRVTYQGGSQETAYDYALLRAAELTLARGGEWFQVTNAFNDQDYADGSGPKVSVGGSVGSYGGRTATGLGLGIGFPLGSSTPDTVQTLEIVTGTGPKPDGSNFYDAKSVSDSIRARMANAGS